MGLRVVQWATGNIGTRALREVIRHPDLELAGVVVYDAAKNGVDAEGRRADPQVESVQRKRPSSGEDQAETEEKPNQRSLEA